MKDAIGGIFNLSLLMVVILLVSGFISLAINYTKAYRVKNNVLSYLEKYEGNTGNTDMLDKTYDYIKSIGYVATNTAVTSAENEGYTCPNYNGKKLGWCYRDGEIVNEKFTIDIVVFVNINIPLVKQIFSNFKFFWMPGTTNWIPVMGS